MAAPSPALAVGTTAYWISGTARNSGTVHASPTTYANGTPNKDAGEPFYTFVVGSATVYVRAAEVSATPL